MREYPVQLVVGAVVDCGMILLVQRGFD